LLVLLPTALAFINHPAHRRCLPKFPLHKSLFEPTLHDAQHLYQEAELQMEVLHSGKCIDTALHERDLRFWADLRQRTNRIEEEWKRNNADNDIHESCLLWRFQHFLRVQRIISLPLSGRSRVEGVSRLSLGPLKIMDGGRRQVRALAYYPGLVPLQPSHNPNSFLWLKALREQASIIREELDEFLLNGSDGCDNGVKWIGNDCENFDEHGWTQVSLNSYGKEHEEARLSFPRTLALLEAVKAPIGPRDCCIVRQEAQSGLPRHSDQRNYMLTAHVVLKAPVAALTPASASAAAPTLSPQSKLLQRALAARRKGQETATDTEAAIETTTATSPEGGCSLWCDGRGHAWNEGSSTVIDTTFWHETWNRDENEPVYVLLIDFWHPNLSAAEVAAMRAFLDLEAEYLEAESLPSLRQAAVAIGAEKPPVTVNQGGEFRRRRAFSNEIGFEAGYTADASSSKS
jgi:aspartyl/asparaginyl beta-hydroxylase (cupin superfamily)